MCTHVVRALAVIALLAPSIAPAQNSAKQLLNQPTNPLLNGFRWRAIGPVGPGGRVDDIVVDEKNPSTYYVGCAMSAIDDAWSSKIDSNVVPAFVVLSTPPTAKPT